MNIHVKEQYYIKIDEKDYNNLIKYISKLSPKSDPLKWQLTFNTSDKKRLYYASKTIGGRSGKKWKMHRLIMQLRKVNIDGYEIDHINGDTLDNRFSNLRIATSGQNKTNRDVRSDSKSGFKGVEFQKQNKNWCAYICHDGKKRHLGVFDTADDAAIAYNEAAIDRWGPYARLNIVRKPTKVL